MVLVEVLALPRDGAVVLPGFEVELHAGADHRRLAVEDVADLGLMERCQHVEQNSPLRIPRRGPTPHRPVPAHVLGLARSHLELQVDLLPCESAEVALDDPVALLHDGPLEQCGELIPLNVQHPHCE